ncbi:recombination regulator RecX [Streptomyces sp. NPDC002701]|uniref:recombination regulator RecX n=1 Tax=Streptomyces sp. NPDC002701 TaxID=3364661 RepID=UPI0036A22AFC
MTRRTDWSEYVYPVAPEGQGHGGDISAGDRSGAFGGDGGGPYGGDEPSGPGAWGADGAYGGHGGDHGGGRRTAGGSRRSAGTSRGVGPWQGDGSLGDAPGRGARGWPYGDDGERDGEEGNGEERNGGEPGRRQGRGPREESASSRGGRARGGRGRRRGFGDPPGGGTQDGGPPSSSRAEVGEPPRDPAEQARAICLRLLTGTPRTRKQLADALRKREIPDDVADEVLSRFEEVGLINDGAFAEAWVESRHHGRGLARRALAQELRTKGVDSTLIDEAVAQLDSDQEEATARDLVARRLRATRGLDRDKRIRRLAGMLARKGYSQGTALRVVRQALEEEGEDTEFLGDEEF